MKFRRDKVSEVLIDILLSIVSGLFFGISAGMIFIVMVAAMEWL